MSTDVIFGVIIVVALQIAFIIKIWGMANNVKKMREKLVGDNINTEAQIAYLKGDMARAKDLIDTAFFKSIQFLAINHDEKDRPYDKRYAEKVDEFSGIYKRMELQTPDFVKYQDRSLLLP